MRGTKKTMSFQKLLVFFSGVCINFQKLIALKDAQDRTLSQCDLLCKSFAGPNKGIGLTKKTLANAWVDKSSLSVELRRSFLNLSFVPSFRGNLDV